MVTMSIILVTRPNQTFPYLFLVLVLLATCLSTRSVSGWTPPEPTTPSGTPSGRRQWITQQLVVVVATTTTAATAIPSHATGELPSRLKDFTKLAPLGPSLSRDDKSLSNPNKSYGLSLSELAARLTNDLTRGATGYGSYIISGDLSPDLFRDDCVFVDPTNRVRSLAQYQRALEILFDPQQSTVQLLGPLRVDETERTIAGTFRSRGTLQLPWKPYVKAYESDILYRVDDDGLVYQQEQHWSISSAQALRESFTPGLFRPPPSSTLLQRPPAEPPAVTALFDICNGRRPDEYSDTERTEIAALLQHVQDSQYPWQADLLPGRWKLVYLEPGPQGAGVDRRIPFPELAFNDQFQIFTADGVTNVGELFGPRLYAQVSGRLTELDTTDRQTPKSFRADIQGGQVCYRTAACLPLPIQGVGLFETLYLGKGSGCYKIKTGEEPEEFKSKWSECFGWWIKTRDPKARRL